MAMIQQIRALVYIQSQLIGVKPVLDYQQFALDTKVQVVQVTVCKH